MPLLMPTSCPHCPEFSVISLLFVVILPHLTCAPIHHSLGFTHFYMNVVILYMFFKDVLSHWTVSFSNSSVRLHEERVHLVSLVCGIIVYGHNTIFSTMNMLIIKINWSDTYVQKTSQILSAQLSQLLQGEHYKPIREIGNMTNTHKPPLSSLSLLPKGNHYPHF